MRRCASALRNTQNSPAAASPFADIFLALAGPTACGKSNFALRLAEAFSGEIISIDSGAVYCGMDIGTAKPDSAMQARIRHHLIDVCAPNEDFNVGRFCQLVTAAVQDIQSRGRRPILAGGTMMYYQALSQGLHEMPTPSAAVRQQVREQMKKHGAAAMYQKLAAVDAAAAAKLSPTDTQRLGRAWEILTATGKPLSAWLAGQKRPLLPNLHFVLLLPSERMMLRQAIGRRLDNMFAAGLVEETRQIINRWHLPPAATPLRLAGYRQAAAFLRGEINAADMRRQAYFATCQLAKRQMTWLRRWPNEAIILDPFDRQATARMLAWGQNKTAAHPLCHNPV